MSFQKSVGTIPTWGLFAAAALLAYPSSSSAGPPVCSRTALLQYAACLHEIRDDAFVGKAICLQESERRERRECVREARAERSEATTLCRSQWRARLDVCDLVGEGRYDPEFEPEDFITNFDNPSRQNPYFPIATGFFWEFETEDESNRVVVTEKTKLIDDVTCVVVNDLVTKEDGGEDTDDWFALHRDGSLYYCGEAVEDFEFFEGDQPMEAELIAIDGSFKADRDGDAPGILVPADPRPGMTYRQEWSASNAEDLATVITTTYRYGENPELDEFMDPALAEHLCSAGDCLVTRDFTPLEPDGFEYKFYAKHLGPFFEIKPEDGETNRLVACNVDARCDSLP